MSAVQLRSPSLLAAVLVVLIMALPEPAGAEPLFTPPIFVSQLDDNAHALVAGDVNGDGRMDLGVLNQGSSMVSLLLSAPGGTFLPKQDLDTGAVPEDLVLKDFDHDGRLDLAVAQSEARHVSIFSGHGDGTFGPPTVIPITGKPLSLAGGDLDEDGFIDLVVSSDAGVWAFFGGAGGVGGSGRFTNVMPLPGTVGWPYNGSRGRLIVVDFTGDGQLDIALLGNDVDFVAGNGDGTFGSPGQVWADHDNDGGYAGPLVAVTDETCTSRVFSTWYCCGCTNCGDDISLTWVLGPGCGEDGCSGGYRSLDGLGRVTDQAKDLNGDGAEDLLTTGGFVLFGPGFASQQRITPYGSLSAAVGDLNGDAKPDLFLLRSSNGGRIVDVLLNEGPAHPDTTLPTPVPRFTAPTTVQPGTIYLEDTFDITLRVGNEGRASDDGRINVSFPSFTDPGDGARVSCSAGLDLPGFVTTPAGGTLSGADCQPVTASCLAAEYVDVDWRTRDLGCVPSVETNVVTFTVRPAATGTFEFYVRSTMHSAGGSPCEFVNGLPAGGEAGYIDQQGWPVKRFVVTVLPQPTETKPTYMDPVRVQGDSIPLGQTVKITIAVRNDGALSDDGRIVVGFPTLTSPSDGELVSSTSAGDSPGYRELAAGAASSDSLCQPIVASHLMAEYVDSDWRRLGAEIDTLILTVKPKEVGTFYFDVRSTMRAAGDPPCAYLNAIPAGGVGVVTDPQGWSVQRFAMTVLPPKPQPTFTDAVTLGPAATITLGHSFTLTTTVINAGSDTDDGRIVVSFPNLTALTAAQWVSATSSGDDAPGYREWPRGSVLQLPGCAGIIADYLSVEYADDAWSGGGSETNQLSLTVTPQATGAFPILLRSTMRWAPRGPCAYVDGLPANLATTGDQQGRPVGVIWVQVVPPAPPPSFTSAVGIPASIVLGESFTITAAVRNDGPLTDDGRISFGFPNLTRPADSGRVRIGQADDLPGSAIRVAGTALSDSACQAMNADHLVAEYTDSSWATGEMNTFFVTVQPESSGTFYVDVRAIVHDVAFSGGTCRYVNALPPGGSPVTDQQGWTAWRFAVTVYGPEGPLPPPSIAWGPMVVPAGGPSPRGGAAAVYRPGSHSIVIYGGQSPAYTGDVWSLPLGDGGAWSRISPGGPVPLRRIMHSMILNRDDQLVIFGGLYDFFLNDVQVMTLGGNPWWFPNPGHGTPPSVRGGHAAVYDSVRDRMLVIGGFGAALLNDVWEYSPSGTGTWRQLTPAGSPMPPRAQAAAVYDPVRDRIIVFGGDGGFSLNDVWALNLSGEPAWEELHPTGNAPSPRREHTAIYDPAGDRVIVYGGFDIDRVRRGDVWALGLSGTPSWHMLVSSTPPPTARSGHVAIYDTQLRRMVMFGGQIGTNQYSDEVWALNLDASTPVAASLVSSEVHSDLVRLTWAAEGAAILSARVQRSSGGDEWTDLGKPSIAGADRLVFEDHAVTPGTRYGYRLAVMDGGQETVFEPVWVTIPLPAVLSLAGATPNPSEGMVAVRFSLAGDHPATLELFDLRGRRVAWREVGTMGAGEHVVPFSERPDLPAGVYLLRLTQDRRVLTAKACVVR